uniref:Uncharacterized protein n=1 Tax=Setaria viridis TaxID=4556 RepID=A0A4U6UXP9_SETVI|nr:hypothetical protein SEVIR_4G081400v2 [Setaria viridis]
MSDEKRMERNKKRCDCYMINNVVDKENIVVGGYSIFSCVTLQLICHIHVTLFTLQVQVVGGSISMVKDENDDWLHRGDLDKNDERLCERDLDRNDDLIHVSGGPRRTKYRVLIHEDDILSDMWDNCVDSCISPVVGVYEDDHSTGTGFIPVEQTGNFLFKFPAKTFLTSFRLL